MTIKEIGCCGAYCRTCREYRGGHCKGCKLGYENGERDISRAKCRMKVCCFARKGLETCADCTEFESCDIIRSWYGKGYKYDRYRRQLEYIRACGYEKFIEVADGWKESKGKL